VDATESPGKPIDRSQVVSDTAGPEAMVRDFIDALNRGRGDAMDEPWVPTSSLQFESWTVSATRVTDVVVCRAKLSSRGFGQRPHLHLHCE